MPLAEWTHIRSTDRSTVVYGGFNPEWAAGKLERQIVDNIVCKYKQIYPEQKIFFAVTTWHEPVDILDESIKYNPDLTVLFSLTDPLGPIEKFIHKFTCPVKIVGYSHQKENFIDFWAIACYKFFKKYNLESLIPQQSFEYTFLNYNRKPHHHRVRLIQQLEKYNLIEHMGCVTLGDSDYHLNEQRSDFVEWGANDVVNNLNIPNDIYSLGNLNIWNSSFLNIVSETEYEFNNNVFLSEKIFKPIIGLRPFVLNGSPGIYGILKNAGFDCFDDIFPVDELSSLNKDDVYPTHQAILRTIDDLKNENLEKLYQKILPRLINNQQLFFEYGKYHENNATVKSAI